MMVVMMMMMMMTTWATKFPVFGKFCDKILPYYLYGIFVTLTSMRWCAVDLTMSGPGRVAVDVRGEVTRPLVEVAERCEGLLTVSFVPQECCLHTVVITMNGSPVPGETSCYFQILGPAAKSGTLCDNALLLFVCSSVCLSSVFFLMQLGFLFS